MISSLLVTVVVLVRRGDLPTTAGVKSPDCVLGFMHPYGRPYGRVDRYHAGIIRNVWIMIPVSSLLEPAGSCRMIAPIMKIDRIVSLTIVGGFLDGTRIEFLPGLNCIIGGRGTGKTTVIEFVRWTLDALPRHDLSPLARKRVEKLVEGNLQGGRVELEVETRDGLRYCITRSVGENPLVLDSNRNPTALSVGPMSFFRADIFSQNEVETIADHGRFQLELIDSFALDEVSELERAAAEVVMQITSHAKQVQPLLARLSVLTEELKQLPAIEERLKGFATGADKLSEEVTKAHGLKALRDRENRLLETSREFLAGFDLDLVGVSGRFKTEFSGKFTAELTQGPNGEIIGSLKAKLVACSKVVEDAIAAARKAVTECFAAIGADDEEALKLAHGQQDLAFRELIEKHKQHQTQSAERVNLEKKRNKLLENKNEADELRRQLLAADKRRCELLAKLSETRDRRFGVRKQVAERLNASLSPNITVSIQQDGDTSGYRDLIETSMKGSRVHQGVVAQKLVRTLPPAQLAELVRTSDVQRLMEQADLNVDQAGKLVATFNSPDKLAELETVALHDAPAIKLRVGEQEKESSTLSTGQKCTTILPVLLLEGGSPLLIDQPEDNLDNRFIFETVVAQHPQGEADSPTDLRHAQPEHPCSGRCSEGVGHGIRRGACPHDRGRLG